MTLIAATANPSAAGQILLASVLGAAGLFLLLPKPRARSVALGTAAVIAAAGVVAAWLIRTFGNPMADTVGTILFWLFSLGAVGFGVVLVVQRNPARGAIAFAFVVLSTCGLFLLLAAPFLMAATVIVYAGAIIVTFLFVLMLSNPKGQSNENDRSREPLLGSLAGFAFVGLVLLTLHQTYLSVTPSAVIGPRKPEARLPAPVLTTAERATLTDAAEKLLQAEVVLSGDLSTGRQERIDFLSRIQSSLVEVVGTALAKGTAEPEEERFGTLRARLNDYRSDIQANGVLARAAVVRDLNQRLFGKLLDDVLLSQKPDVKPILPELHKLRDEVRLLAGSGELPARNVGTIGLLLYSDHLLAVELAGTLLLVATIGAVAIARRKGPVIA